MSFLANEKGKGTRKPGAFAFSDFVLGCIFS